MQKYLENGIWKKVKLWFNNPLILRIVLKTQKRWSNNQKA